MQYDFLILNILLNLMTLVIGLEPIRDNYRITIGIHPVDPHEIAAGTFGSGPRHG